jgi:hypothetical protein
MPMRNGKLLQHRNGGLIAGKLPNMDYRLFYSGNHLRVDVLLGSR